MKLKNERDSLTHKDLDQIDAKILVLIEQSKYVYGVEVGGMLNLNQTLVEFHLTKLHDNRYLHVTRELGRPDLYDLTQKARGYLINNNLLPPSER